MCFLLSASLHVLATYLFCKSVYREVPMAKLSVFGTCFIDDLELFLVCRRCDYDSLQVTIHAFMSQFEVSTFPDPLVLERDDGDGYLETLLRVVGNDVLISHNTKIDLDALLTSGDTLLRLHTFNSFCPRQLLYGILVGTLCRVVANTSHSHLLEGPVRSVLTEFELLGYPVRLCRAAVRDVAKKRCSDGLAVVSTELDL